MKWLVLFFTVLVGTAIAGDSKEENSQEKKSEEDCPDGWLKADETKSCYLFVKWRFNWIDAGRNCEGKGGHLVSINNMEEQLFLQEHAPEWAKAGNWMDGFSRNFWTSLNDIDDEGQFKWHDGSGLTYTRWKWQEPNNKDWEENVMAIADNGFWNDVPWNYQYSSICEKEL